MRFRWHRHFLMFQELALHGCGKAKAAALFDGLAIFVNHQ
jgi:hypothetical protein